MKVNVFSLSESEEPTLTGSVTVDADGNAEFDEATAWLLELYVVDPSTGVQVSPTDGRAFVAALPANLRGSYMWAELDPLG